MPEGTLIEQKQYIHRPWAGQVRDPEIPNEWRTYALSLQTGDVVMLDEEWKPNDATGRLEKVPESLDIHNKWPLLSYDEVELLFATAEESGESIPHTFAKLFGRDRLTLKQVGELTHLRQQYAAPTVMEKKRKKVRRQEDEDAMIAAAGIEIPDVLKGAAAISPEALERRNLATLAAGGVSADLPKGIKLRGKEVGTHTLGKPIPPRNAGLGIEA
jgi:hypothetical protein